MNLIEQLGGYEKANGYLHELYKIPMHEQTEDTITWLPLLLLQYRREHNIFEVGDFIVLLHTNYRSDVFALTKSFKEIYDEKGIVYRHATDAEIQAGHRL